MASPNSLTVSKVMVQAPRAVRVISASNTWGFSGELVARTGPAVIPASGPVAWMIIWPSLMISSLSADWMSMLRWRFPTFGLPGNTPTRKR